MNDYKKLMTEDEQKLFLQTLHFYKIYYESEISRLKLEIQQFEILARYCENTRLTKDPVFVRKDLISYFEFKILKIEKKLENYYDEK